MADYTYEGIRAGIVANLAPLGFQSTGYVLGSPTLGALECFPGEVDYDQAFARGHDELEWTVRLTMAVTLDVAAQMKLDQYLAPAGALSVKTLLEADTTLGGAVVDLRVTQASGYQVIQLKDGGQGLACDWTVELVA